MYVTRKPESLKSGEYHYKLERKLTGSELTHFCFQPWEDFCQYEHHSQELLFDEGIHIDDELMVVLKWFYSL